MTAPQRIENLDGVRAAAELTWRAQAVVERALRQNEHRWQSLTEADRRRVEMLAHAVASRLLHEPVRALETADGNGESPARVRVACELFGLDAGAD